MREGPWANTNLHSCGDRGGSEEPTQAYLGYVEESVSSDNEGIHEGKLYRRCDYVRASAEEG